MRREAGRGDRSELTSLAREVGNDWKEGPYYDEAEAAMDADWTALIWPLIEDCDFTMHRQARCGHGRNSEKLRHLAETGSTSSISIAKISTSSGSASADATNIVLVHNDGVSLDAIPDRRATLVYSFDAMVHFDSDVVRAYLREFERVLRRGGRCFCHYSNYTVDPTGSYHDHPGGRNFMSRELFEHYASKEGLHPVESQLIRADGDAALRCSRSLSRRMGNQLASARSRRADVVNASHRIADRAPAFFRRFCVSTCSR